MFDLWNDTCTCLSVFFTQHIDFTFTMQKQSTRGAVFACSFQRFKNKMPRGVKKENLPSKICVTCKRPFTWRKKWEKCWDEVTTCSKRCNAERKDGKKSAGQHEDIFSSGDEREDVKVTASASSDAPHKAKKPAKKKGGRRAALHSDSDSPYESDRERLKTGSASATLDVDPNLGDPIDSKKVKKDARKQAKKLVKEQKRLQRQGGAPAEYGQKPCDLCSKKVDLLIRCQTDASGVFRMVCGKCWPSVSGGVVDGDAEHPFYRYGGLWKNRHIKEDTGYAKSRARKGKDNPNVDNGNEKKIEGEEDGLDALLISKMQEVGIFVESGSDASAGEE